MNNKAFHNATKVRETRNAIREIKCSDRNIVTMQEDIKKETERFFNDFLTFELTSMQGKKEEELQDILPFRCNEEERTRLTKMVREEEKRDVVFRMPSNKSP